ncbi:MAG: hypothetical protein ABSF37_07880 [Sedimentisphaerales bacterium]|jgi:hypothetical protein
MTIKEKIEKALAGNKRMSAKDPQKLSEFVEELRREGLLVKKEYDLPLLDTVGRQFYQQSVLGALKKV